MAKIFYKDAKVIIFVYDITSEPTFEGMKNYWYEQVKLNCEKDAILAVVANKNDLYNEQIVEDEEAIKYAESINAMFFKTSAKSNSELDLLFKILGRKFIEPDFDYKKYEEEEKESYNEKRENEKKEKKSKREKRETIENDNEFENSIDSIKLYDNMGKKKNKKLCC
jgi:GTPase SAR1 family protein